MENVKEREDAIQINAVSMDVEEFLTLEQMWSEGYCACLIEENGNVCTLKSNHLNALIDYYGNADILSDLADDVAPMFWLISKTKVVVVDYENQLYYKHLTKAQGKTLRVLEEAGCIHPHLIDIQHQLRL